MWPKEHPPPSSPHPTLHLGALCILACRCLPVLPPRLGRLDYTDFASHFDYGGGEAGLRNRARMWEDDEERYHSAPLDQEEAGGGRAPLRCAGAPYATGAGDSRLTHLGHPPAADRC